MNQEIARKGHRTVQSRGKKKKITDGPSRGPTKEKRAERKGRIWQYRERTGSKKKVTKLTVFRRCQGPLW